MPRLHRITSSLPREQSRLEHNDEFLISTQPRVISSRVNSDVGIFQIVRYGIQNFQEQVSAQSPEVWRFCNLQWKTGEKKRVSCLDALTRETSLIKPEKFHAYDVSQCHACLWLVVARFWIFAQKKLPMRILTRRATGISFFNIVPVHSDSLLALNFRA